MAASSFRHRTYLLFFLLPYLISHVSANCYWPNGTDRNSGGLPPNLYDACNPSASASMCCALDSTSIFLNADSGTICRSDGLCINENGKKVTRTACTDRTWQSPQCIKLCVNGTNQANNDVFITPCDDGSYCCGNNAVAKSCCESGLGYFIVDGEETRVNPNGTSTSSSTSSVAGTASGASSSASRSGSSSTSSSTPGPQTVTQVVSSAPVATSALPTPISEHSKNAGVIAGAVVGGVLGLAVIVGVCWFLIHRRRRPSPGQPPPKSNSQFPLELGSHYLAEAPTYAGDVRRNELPGPPVSRPELNGSKGSYYELDDRS